MAEFTPGPWRISAVNRKRSVTVRALPADIGIATINSNLHQDANAHLIAAAPSMYEALLNARQWMESYRDDIEGYEDQDALEGLKKDIETVSRILAKAKGEKDCQEKEP